MELTHVFRQKDQEFVQVLNQIRRGICTDEMIDMFATYGSNLKNAGGIKVCLRSSRTRFIAELHFAQPTNLYPLVAAVDKENAVEYAKLTGEEYRYQALDNVIGPNSAERAKSRVSSSFLLISHD